MKIPGLDRPSLASLVAFMTDTTAIVNTFAFLMDVPLVCLFWLLTVTKVCLIASSAGVHCRG
jgi:hypothetical protein